MNIHRDCCCPSDRAELNDNSFNILNGIVSSTLIKCPFFAAQIIKILSTVQSFQRRSACNWHYYSLKDDHVGLLMAVFIDRKSCLEVV